MIRFLIDIYIFILIADIILSYIPDIKNHQATQFIKKIADFTCRPIRKQLPPDLPFDFSPLIVMLLLRLFVAIF